MNYTVSIKKAMVAFLACMMLLLGISTVSASQQQSFEGVVTTAVLNVRSQGTTNSQILGQLYGGNVVPIIGTDGNWFKIVYNEMAAFVHSDYISLRDASSSRGDQKRTQAEAVVDYAKRLIGCPYSYGGSSPSGFDCSGFTSYVYNQFGISLNRTAAAQTDNGTYVERQNLQPGDLVMFATNGGGTISHVGIYVGGGNFIHSPKPGQTVRIETMSSGYYNSRYVTARRIF